ncbi:MAG: phage minor head protein [Burkholderiaceae bacterium]|nr:phage minor head protein [Burkholderiaceae bacterium]
MAKKLDLKPVLAAVDPEEAIAYFRQKGYRIGFDHRDVWQQEHQAGFTVAKAMQVDLLQDIRQEVDKALASGTTLADFQKALTPRLQARGWWGKQERVDPVDGEAKLVQLGSPRRLEVIFDTNLATAYSEGQGERIQRNQELFPFLEYVRSASVNPRHTHLAYAGLVLPVNDPFWQSHLPVKEWGCKCTVVQHTRRMLDREGLTVGKAPPEVMRTLVNKRTGEVMQVPTGVDPAFHYPPGGRRANLEKLLTDKLAAASSYKAQSFAQATRGIADRLLIHPMGPVPAAARIEAATGLPVAGYAAVMDNYAVRHTLRQHGNVKAELGRGQLPIDEDDFGLVPLIMGEADDVFADGKTKQGRDVVVFTKVVGDVGYWLVQEVRPGKGQLAMVSMRKKPGAWSPKK